MQNGINVKFRDYWKGKHFSSMYYYVYFTTSNAMYVLLMYVLLFEIVCVFCRFSAGALVAFLLTYMSYLYIWSTLLTCSGFPTLQSRYLRPVV